MKFNIKETERWTAYVPLETDGLWNEFLKKWDYKKSKLILDGVNFFINYFELVNSTSLEKKPDLSYESLKKVLTESHKLYEEELRNPSSEIYTEIRKRLTPISGNLQLAIENIPNNETDTLECLKEVGADLGSLIKSLKVLYGDIEKINDEPLFEILYIEDDPATAKMVCKRVEKDGHSIRVAGTAEDGLNELTLSNPKLIMIDLKLPKGGMQGDELSLYLKSDDKYKNIPIVLVSASISNKELKKIKEKTDLEMIILKPFNLESFKTIYSLFD